MAFALFIAGIVLLVAAVRNTQNDLFGLLRNDFTGPGNFIFWFLAILIIGALGYVPKLKGFSVAFLSLLIIVLFLKRGNPQTGTGGGFFQQFIQAVSLTQSSTPSTSTQATAQTGQSGIIPALPNLSQVFQ